VTVFVDSDILIEVSRGRDQPVVARWRELAASDALVLYSAVSAAELWAGARAGEEDSLTALFESLVCVPVGPDTGRRAGQYLSRYRKSHGMELGDALIAASAAGRGAALWTRNRRHYPMKDVRFFE
jgi:predicted nucleic acid-binding protein